MKVGPSWISMILAVRNKKPPLGDVQNASSSFAGDRVAKTDVDG